MAHCNTHSYSSQYVRVFDGKNTRTYGAPMKLRDILKALMGFAGDDAYTLQEKSKVPQPTTQRFLSGSHGEPRSSTVQKWALAYGITESQLRGDVPLPPRYKSLGFPTDENSIGGSISEEEQRVLDLFRSMNAAEKRRWLLASWSVRDTAPDEKVAKHLPVAPTEHKDYSTHRSYGKAPIQRHAKIKTNTQKPPSNKVKKKA